MLSKAICTVPRNFLLMVNFPKGQMLDSSKQKVFADDNFKFDENSNRLSKQIENTMEKGEIASNEQFLLFSVFSKEV